MERKAKFILLAIFILLQIAVQRYSNVFRINLDLIYLILVYVAIKSNFYKTLIVATIIGLATDMFSMQILGVFGFARTALAFALNEISNHIDFKNNVVVFLLISISLCLSNSIANLFFYFIEPGFGLSLNMILYQPILTGLAGIALLGNSRIKRILDVY